MSNVSDGSVPTNAQAILVINESINTKPCILINHRQTSFFKKLVKSHGVAQRPWSTCNLHTTSPKCRTAAAVAVDWLLSHAVCIRLRPRLRLPLFTSGMWMAALTILMPPFKLVNNQKRLERARNHRLQGAFAGPGLVFVVHLFKVRAHFSDYSGSSSATASAAAAATTLNAWNLPVGISMKRSAFSVAIPTLFSWKTRFQRQFETFFVQKAYFEDERLRFSFWNSSCGSCFATIYIMKGASWVELDLAVDTWMSLHWFIPHSSTLYSSAWTSQQWFECEKRWGKPKIKS